MPFTPMHFECSLAIFLNFFDIVVHVGVAVAKLGKVGEWEMVKCRTDQPEKFDGKCCQSVSHGLMRRTFGEF